LFYTEVKLNVFVDNKSDDKRNLVEEVLEELNKVHEIKDLDIVTLFLDKLNEAWKNASEEMYKAQLQQAQQGGGLAQQGNAQGAEQQQSGQNQSSDDNDDVEDVDFEEVK